MALLSHMSCTISWYHAVIRGPFHYMCQQPSELLSICWHIHISRFATWPEQCKLGRWYARWKRELGWEGMHDSGHAGDPAGVGRRDHAPVRAGASRGLAQKQAWRSSRPRRATFCHLGNIIENQASKLTMAKGRNAFTAPLDTPTVGRWCGMVNLTGWSKAKLGRYKPNASKGKGDFLVGHVTELNHTNISCACWQNVARFKVQKGS